MPTAKRVIATTSATVLLYLLWRSLEWPLIHDTALMHYIAWLISQGAVPYRDTFDMNMPGVYLIHLAVIAVGGAGDLAWLVFERGWLAVTVGLMYFFGRPLGDRWTGAIAALLFAIHHVGGGASLAGQRDFLLCVFLLAGAYGVACSYESRGRLLPLLWAGLILGFAVMVKPLAGLFFAVCTGATAIIARRAGRSWLIATGAMLGAGAVAPTLMFGWLALIGGLGPFFLILIGWTVPFYSQLGGESPLWQLRSLIWVVLGAAALLGAIRKPPEPYGIRGWLAVAGVVYGVLHFGLQSKGYDYHLYPLAMFLCLLSTIALAPETPGARISRVRVPARGLGVVVLAAVVVVLGGRGLQKLNRPWDDQRARRVNQVVEDLQKLLPPGETVQVLGPPGGHVLLRLRLQQPTRFFTDFQFYLRTADPRIAALRTEFMAGLEARPPAAIVAFPGRGANGPYGRLTDFPALNQFLGRHYNHVLEGNGYRIYARRPDL